MKYPSGFKLAVHMTKKEYHIRLMAALKMFELGKVLSAAGKAADPKLLTIYF